MLPYFCARQSLIWTPIRASTRSEKSVSLSSDCRAQPPAKAKWHIMQEVNIGISPFSFCRTTWPWAGPSLIRVQWRLPPSPCFQVRIPLHSVTFPIGEKCTVKIVVFGKGGIFDQENSKRNRLEFLSLHCSDQLGTSTSSKTWRLLLRDNLNSALTLQVRESFCHQMMPTPQQLMPALSMYHPTL